MVVHLEISTYVFFAFMSGCNLGNFDYFYTFLCHFSKFDDLKKRIMIICSLTSIFSLLSRHHARATFWCYHPIIKKKIRLKDLFGSFKLFFRQKITHTKQHFKVSSVKKIHLYFFPTRLATVFIKLRKTLPFPYFLIF